MRIDSGTIGMESVRTYTTVSAKRMQAGTATYTGDRLSGGMGGLFGNLLNISDCKNDKEYFTTSVQVQADGGFFNWVAGMGGNVIITGPECVREAYKEYLQEQLKLYK